MVCVDMDKGSNVFLVFQLNIPFARENWLMKETLSWHFHLYLDVNHEILLWNKIALAMLPILSDVFSAYTTKSVKRA